MNQNALIQVKVPQECPEVEQKKAFLLKQEGLYSSSALI